jgi:putative ABC transport system ATP-binding protein
MMANVQNGGAAVSVNGLRHAYRSPAGSLSVLEDVSFHADAGDYCALMGPSGSGKTTLLGLLGGLDVIQGGSIRVGDVDVAALAGDDLAEYRRRTVGFVFQHFGLLESLTAAENVELAGTLAGDAPGVRRARAAELLDAVGLRERAGHRPGQLSGGERQRVAMARALANRPRLLLADEPTGNLDEESASGVIDVLEALRERTGCTLILVTHNRALADRASRRLVLHGRKVAPE